MPVVKLFSTVLFLLFFTSVAYSQDNAGDISGYHEGTDYEFIKNGQPMVVKKGTGKLEVAYFMWYGCGSCYRTESVIQQWAKKLPNDVQFFALPPIFGGPSTSHYLHARLFMTIDEMGLGYNAHLAIFKRFHDERLPVRKDSELTDVAKMIAVDPDKFIKTYNSPAVDAKMKWLQNIVDAYQIDRVPMMVINGKYRFDIAMAQGGENMTKLADVLLDHERQAAKTQ